MFARALATIISVVAGVGAGYATNMLTNKWSLTWWIALSVSAVFIIASQLWLSGRQSQSSVRSSGVGTIAVGKGVNGDVSTKVRGRFSNTPPSKHEPGVTADGVGTIASGGALAGNASTDVDIN